MHLTAWLPSTCMPMPSCLTLQEMDRQRWEEHRKSQQEAAQTKAELARYEDELTRQRSAAEHEKAKQRNAEMVSLQSENLRRQNEEKLRLQAQIEAERRATEQYRVSHWCCFQKGTSSWSWVTWLTQPS